MMQFVNCKNILFSIIKLLVTDDDDELQWKSAPIHATLSTQNTTMNQDNSIEIKKLTTSIESMRTSVLQA